MCKKIIHHVAGSITIAQISYDLSPIMHNKHEYAHVTRHICWTGCTCVYAHLVSTLHDHAVWTFTNHTQVLIFLHCYVSTATPTIHKLLPSHLSWNGGSKNRQSTVDFETFTAYKQSPSMNFLAAKTCSSTLCTLSAVLLSATVIILCLCSSKTSSKPILILEVS